MYTFIDFDFSYYKEIFLPEHSILMISFSWYVR